MKLVKNEEANLQDWTSHIGEFLSMTGAIELLQILYCVLNVIEDPSTALNASIETCAVTAMTLWGAEKMFMWKGIK